MYHEQVTVQSCVLFISVGTMYCTILQSHVASFPLHLPCIDG